MQDRYEGTESPPEKALKVAGFEFPFCKGSVGKRAAELDEYDAMVVLYRINKGKEPTWLNKVGANFYALYGYKKIETFASRDDEGRERVKLLEMDGAHYAVTCQQSSKIGADNHLRYRLTFKLIPDAAPAVTPAAKDQKALDTQVTQTIREEVEVLQDGLTQLQKEVMPTSGTDRAPAAAIPAETRFERPEVDVQPVNKYEPILGLLSYGMDDINLVGGVEHIGDKMRYSYTDARYPGYTMQETANGSFPEQVDIQNAGGQVAKLIFEYRYNESGPAWGIDPTLPRQEIARLQKVQMDDRYNAQLAISRKYPNVFPMSRWNFVGIEMKGERYIVCNDSSGNILLFTLKEAQNISGIITDANPRESFFIEKWRHIQDPALAWIIANFSKRAKTMYRQSAKIGSR